jgi:chitodextrinase
MRVANTGTGVEVSQNIPEAKYTKMVAKDDKAPEVALPKAAMPAPVSVLASKGRKKQTYTRKPASIDD